MSTQVKICGLSTKEALNAVIKVKADYAGFVYYQKSPRHVSINQAANLRLALPKNINSVMVMVNPDNGLLTEIAREVNPDFFQLHGEETPERIKEIKNIFPYIGIIKSIPVRVKEDLIQTDQYIKIVDYLLFDAKPTNNGMMHGGNGLSFDWNILAGKKFTTPWFLSGGLNAENVVQAKKTSGAKMVDISSGVERSAGVKDAKMIEEFVKAARA